MSKAGLGAWRRPPLAYVVAELAISPHYSLKSFLAPLQDALREDFPRTIEGQELVIDMASPPTAQPVWRLLSADQRRGVQIGSRGLSLHATEYTDSADFLERWGKVLAVIEGCKLGAFVERAGLRYLDLIVPSEGREPKDYLIENLHGLGPPLGGVVQNSLWGTAIQVDGFLVQARIAAPSPAGTMFAPNFNLLPLQKPQIMEEAERRMAARGLVGFIDTDCLREVQQTLSAADVGALYTDLHAQVARIFKSLLSKVAMDEWQ